MSIAIQKEIDQQVATIQANNLQLEWFEFVQYVAGDNEHLMAYIPILRSISASECSTELSVKFDTIRGQFASSEEKMIGLLTTAEFTEGTDFCSIDVVTSDKLNETVLFLSYRCIKLFVMDRNDAHMTRAMMIGEQLYNTYQAYSKAFIKERPARTHYIIVEQRSTKLSTTLATYAKTMLPTEFTLIIRTGTVDSLSKFQETMVKDGNEWGKVIVPMTRAIFSDASEDTNRMADHVTQALVKPYKDRVRAELKAKGKAQGKPITAPKTTVEWGCMIRSTFIMLMDNHQHRPFTYDQLVDCVKEQFLANLAQQHVSIDGLSHKKYLKCVEHWEAEREEQAGRFSALRANAAIQFKITQKQKAIDREIAKAKKVETKEKKVAAAVPLEPVRTHGAETSGSDNEHVPKDESVDDRPELIEEEVELEDEVEEKVKPKGKPSKAKKAPKEKVEDDSEPEVKPKEKVEEESEEEPEVKPKGKPSKAKKAPKEKVEDESEEEPEIKPKGKPTKAKIKSQRILIATKEAMPASDSDELNELDDAVDSDAD